MELSWLSLVPPFVVLICAFITKKLNLALATGLTVAVIIATNFSLPEALTLVSQHITAQITNIENIYMYSFLLLIGIIIVLLNVSGGATAFAHIVTKKLRNAKMVETSSLLLSMSLFIDDYLSNLTTGYVMRPLTDKFKIPRAKLAFLVHSMTVPLVILAPISSWAAMITGQLDQAGVAPIKEAGVKIIADPFFIYINSIPFIFYSFIMLLSVWFIVRKRISFGSMATHEQRAQKYDDLFGGKPVLKEKIGTDHSIENTSITDLLVPLMTLLASVFIGIAYVSDFHLFGGSKTLWEALKNNNEIFPVLFWAGTISLIVSGIFSLTRKKISIQKIPSIVYDGIKLMWPPVVMVFLAGTLGSVLQQNLFTGHYLASVLLGSVSIPLLPVMFFFVSLLGTIITGSSWGTIALMLPISLPMLTTLLGVTTPTTPAMIPVLFPVLGAIFSGAVCGDHISPISETTIMAATSAGTYPLDHTQTQLPYALPAIISSAFAFLIAGLLINYSTIVIIGTSLGVGIVSNLCMLLVMHKKSQQI